MIINKNPIHTIKNKLKDILNRWTNKNFITHHTKQFLTSNGALLSRAYRVPKIHKPGYSFRIIFSTVNSSLHKLASFLHKILYNSIPFSPFFVKDNFHLYNMLSGFKLSENHIIASLDAVSLFTNIPIRTSIRLRVEEMETYQITHKNISR